MYEADNTTAIFPVKQPQSFLRNAGRAAARMEVMRLHGWRKQLGGDRSDGGMDGLGVDDTTITKANAEAAYIVNLTRGAMGLDPLPKDISAPAFTLNIDDNLKTLLIGAAVLGGAYLLLKRR